MARMLVDFRLYSYLTERMCGSPKEIQRVLLAQAHNKYISCAQQYYTCVKYDKAKHTIVNDIIMAPSDITKPIIAAYEKKASPMDKETAATRKENSVMIKRDVIQDMMQNKSVL
jgi:hypothetical protein